MLRFIARNCLYSCGSWPGKSEICSAGCQEGQAGTLSEASIHRLNLFFIGEASVSLLVFQSLNQTHPDNLLILYSYLKLTVYGLLSYLQNTFTATPRLDFE